MTAKQWWWRVCTERRAGLWKRHMSCVCRWENAWRSCSGVLTSSTRSGCRRLPARWTGLPAASRIPYAINAPGTRVGATTPATTIKRFAARWPLAQLGATLSPTKGGCASPPDRVDGDRNNRCPHKQHACCHHGKADAQECGTRLSRRPEQQAQEDVGHSFARRIETRSFPAGAHRLGTTPPASVRLGGDHPPRPQPLTPLESYR